MSTIAATFSELRRATVEARGRTGDQHIGTQVGGGIWSVVRAIPPKSGRGSYTIDYQRAGLTMAQAIEFLDAYKGPAK